MELLYLGDEFELSTSNLIRLGLVHDYKETSITGYGYVSFKTVDKNKQILDDINRKQENGKITKNRDSKSSNYDE